MAGLELLSDQGFRIDGRRPTELRKFKCEIGTSQQADGSAYIEQGNTKVMISVYGPHNITGRKSKAPTDKVFVNCELTIAPFSTAERRKVSRSDRKSQVMTLVLKQTFEAAILTTLYPGSQIDIFFLVLEADGGIYSACINGGTLALINAGVPLKDYVCACSAGFVNETPLMDISHIEGMLGGTELNLAILPRSGSIVCQELTARIHKDHLAAVFKAAFSGCNDVYAVLDSVVRKYTVKDIH